MEGLTKGSRARAQALLEEQSEKGSGDAGMKASEVPLPEQDADMLQARDGAGREEGVESPKKQRVADKGTEVVTVDLLKSLLSDTKDVFLRANRETVREEVRALEERQAKKLKDIGDEVSSHHDRIHKLEQALLDVQAKIDKGDAGSTTASEGNRSEQRRTTLVIGGFPRDSRRQVVLKETNAVLKKLNLLALTDRDAFCTGPRRSFCLLPFAPRTHEREDQVRERLHQVMTGINKSRTTIDGMSRPMWAGP